MKETLSGIMLTLPLIGMLTLAFDIQSVEASGTIYARGLVLEAATFTIFLKPLKF